MRNHNLTEKNLDEDALLAKKSNKTPKHIDTSYLQGQLLIAMPGLNDPYFKQSVTLICQHNEEGCFGLTINKPTNTNVLEVLKQLTVNSEEKLSNINNSKSSELNLSKLVLRGGPVKIEQGYVIHDGDKQWENSLIINNNLSVTLSKDILFDIVAGNGPENYLFTLGCSSWTGGQIESEIISNSWLNCSIDNQIIFDMPFEKRWQGAADILGVNLSAMSGISGHD